MTGKLRRTSVRDKMMTGDNKIKRWLATSQQALECGGSATAQVQQACSGLIERLIERSAPPVQRPLAVQG